MRSLLFSLAVVLSLCALSKAGSVTLDKSCNVTADCITNAECVIPAPCDDGKCKCPTTTHYIKADKCEAKIANGEACTSVGAALECVSGMCKGGNCFVKKDNDADCTDGTDCTSGYCKAGTPTKKCAALAALGAACTVNEDCMTGTCDTPTNNKCICGTGLKPDTGNTKCIPKFDLETPCAAATESGKATEAECQLGRLVGSTKCETGKTCKCKYVALADGFCSALQAYDGACTADTDCENGKCATNKCACMDEMTWDITTKMCKKNKKAKDADCDKGDMCEDSNQTCAKCGKETKYTCQTNKKTDNTTGGATMIAVSLTTLFTSILALVL